MNQKTPELKLRIPKESPTFLVLERIKSCRKKNKEIIFFPDIFSKLCTSLQLSKEKVWSLLFFLHDIGVIKIIYGHGVKILWEVENEK